MALRWLSWCRLRATSSFPEPFGPVISTLASVGATLAMISRIRRMGAESPIMSAPYTFFFRALFWVVRCTLSEAFFMVMSTRLRSRGFSTKSNAPFFMQSTAVAMSACPEIITTAESPSDATIFSNTSTPSMPGILMSQKITSNFSLSIIARAEGPSSAHSAS